MTRKIALSLLLCWLGSLPCLAQTDSIPSPDPAIVRLLTSPYAAERKLGVGALVKAAQKAGDDQFYPAWLNDHRPLVRFGAASAVAQCLDGARATSLILAVMKREAQKMRREELGKIAFFAAFNAWDGKSDFFEGTDSNRDLAASAIQFVQEKLNALAGAATHTTEFRTLAKLSCLGPHAVPALSRIAGERNAGLAQRALAMSALARMDSRTFWLAKEGTLSSTLTAILDDGPENAKINALFSMAYLGLNDSACIAALKSYVLRDAYSAETIQSGLYYLYTRPTAVVTRETKPMAEVAREYLDEAYAQKVRYNAGLLLAKINVSTLAAKVGAMIREAPDFASYWAMTALLSRSEDLPQETRSQFIESLTDWALQAPKCAPQLKALAVWHRLNEEQALPEGITMESVAAEVRKSMEKIYALSEDPSYLAIRSGLDILAHLGDPKIVKPLRKALKHESEAVRMSAGLAAGASGLKELIPDLVRALADPHEFAAFGAAWGLSQLGDKRAEDWFAHYLLSGNSCLMPSSLAALRSSTKQQIADDTPSDPVAWRNRGRAWCKLLQDTKRDPK